MACFCTRGFAHWFVTYLSPITLSDSSNRRLLPVPKGSYLSSLAGPFWYFLEPMESSSCEIHLQFTLIHVKRSSIWGNSKYNRKATHRKVTMNDRLLWFWLNLIQLFSDWSVNTMVRNSVNCFLLELLKCMGNLNIGSSTCFLLLEHCWQSYVKLS
jgi:hypothetical protein